ncbi:methyl-accepting chemotaxis protein [Salinibaculum salinum]|uniref:methyl-accepting chemotaxis protein n=1 Tax=Salinibaculum salinum TaxID=3131996 RepID=UPI0030EC7E9B
MLSPELLANYLSTEAADSSTESTKNNQTAVQKLTDGGESRSMGSESTAEPQPPDSMTEAFDIHVLLDRLPMPVFALDADHTVVAWNKGMEALYGRSRQEELGSDDYVGRDENGNKVMTLADKVLDATDETSDTQAAENIDNFEKQTSRYCDHDVYTGRATIKTASGEPRHFQLTAVPVVKDGETLGAIQHFEDRTDIVRSQETTENAVEKVTATLEAIGEGDLGARTELDRDEKRQMDDYLLEVIEGVNENAAALESVVNEVRDATTELAEAADETASFAEQIEENVIEQNTTLGEAVEEMNEFSATMEEVAANADSVADQAENAQEAAETGKGASEQAREAIGKVTEQGDELFSSMQALEAQMKEVDEVVDVINQIAEQTNILALNANIEAARVGQGSEGFAVVADEIKTLAEETKSRTDEISDHISDIQERTQETMSVVEETNHQIDQSVDPVENALNALEENATAVEEISTNIQELAKANDDQAATAEEVAAAIDQVMEQAESVESTTDEITDIAYTQRQTVDHLTGQVDRISSGTKT